MPSVTERNKEAIRRLYRFVDGRIAERWVEHGPGVLDQLGIAAPPTAPPPHGDSK